jgi:hypothetical protein
VNPWRTRERCDCLDQDKKHTKQKNKKKEENSNDGTTETMTENLEWKAFHDA